VVVLFNPILVSSLRRFHPLANSSFSGLLYALGFGLFAFATKEWAFLLLTIIYTLGEIIAATNEQYYVANNTPISHRGRFSAILPILMGTGHAIAPVTGGLIIEQYSMYTLWVSTAAAALIGAFMIFCLYLAEKNKKPL
jgi:predicted MFS family arabinose efflux permease